MLTYRPITSLLLALALFGCSAGVDEASAPKLGEKEQAMTTSTHSTGGLQSYFDVKASHPKIAWLMSPRDAVFWTNDPDCKNNNCGKASASVPPGSSFDGSCWALRNPDHFGHNDPATTFGGTPAFSWNGLFDPGSPYSMDQSGLMDAGRPAAISRGAVTNFIPKDSSAAINWYTQAAHQVVLAARTLSPTAASAGLRFSFNACHYEEDQEACGHPVGNRWCNPVGGASQHCLKFVENNSGRLTFGDQAQLSAILAFSGVCGGLPIENNQGLRLAAAERYIRHHARATPLQEGGVDVIEGVGTFPWGTGDSTLVASNGCAASCNSGECLPAGHPEGNGGEATGYEQALRQSCVNRVVSTLDAADANPYLVVSKNFRLSSDAKGQCRDFDNKETCEALGGKCAYYCMRDTLDAAGNRVYENIGTCEPGVPFGADLPRACERGEGMKQTNPNCYYGCKSLEGFIGDDNHCWVPRGFVDAKGDQSVESINATHLTCVEYKVGNKVGCLPWTNEEVCGQLDGGCSSFGTCNRAPTSDNWNFASCSPYEPFRPSLAPSCTEPVPSVTSTITFCPGEGHQCLFDSDCCQGLKCGTPLGQPFSAADNPVCYFPGYGAFQYLGVSLTGSGQGAVSIPSSGQTFATTTLTEMPQGQSLTLKANPQPGSKINGWTGCDSVSSDNVFCQIGNTSLPKSVKAEFQPGSGGGGCSTRCSDRVCGATNECGGVCLLGSGCTLKGQSPSFWDAGQFASYVNGAVTAGFMTPNSANEFGAQTIVTRGEMAAIVIRAKLGDNFTYPATPCFPNDVPATFWQFPYVQKMCELGFAQGYGGGTYGFSDPVTRGQMATFLMRAKYDEPAWAQIFPTHAVPFFSDVTESHPFFRFVQEMRKLGITSGTGTNPATYSPDIGIPREQMAVFVMRVFGGSAFAPTPVSCLPFQSCQSVGWSCGTLWNGCDNVYCGSNGGAC